MKGTFDIVDLCIQLLDFGVSRISWWTVSWRSRKQQLMRCKNPTFSVNDMIVLCSNADEHPRVHQQICSKKHHSVDDCLPLEQKDSLFDVCFDMLQTSQELITLIAKFIDDVRIRSFNIRHRCFGAGRGTSHFFMQSFYELNQHNRSHAQNLRFISDELLTLYAKFNSY